MKFPIRVKPLWSIGYGPTLPIDGTPWICDCRTFDIPNTISDMIKNAAPGLVAVTLSPKGGTKMIQAAERAARKRGVRILWSAL